MNRENIAKNIKYLRKKYGLSQEALAMSIGVGKSTISEYENCKREPQVFILESIANYFAIDFEDLDCENIENFVSDVNLSAIELLDIFIYSLPFFNVKDKEPDIYFKNAYKHNKRIYKSNPDDIIDIFMINIIKENYAKSWNEYKCVEALVNLISIIIFEHQIILPLNSDLDKRLLKIIKKNSYNSDLSKEQINDIENTYYDEIKNNKNIIDVKSKHYESESKRVKQCIKILRNNNKNDLCDYFLGIKLFWGFTNFDLSEHDDIAAINQTALLFLTSLYIDFDNPYAIKFIDYWRKHYN